ncbi:MAG: ATP-binding domain-containing protein, partial [Paludibacteraceae bacterium]|nr:ATP-binding domain-containing protein [Paludibacteraceae bacterium]
KHTFIQSVTGETGAGVTLKSLLDAEINVNGTTAILTRTNEETMQVAYELEQRGLHATIVQSMGGFRFGNLAEVRYFCRQLGKDDSVTISRERWNEAKRQTLKFYATSSCLSIIQHFFADFETIHKEIYRSDLREYIFESNIEDFIAADEKTVFVSTIHKAKGREFDNVYLMAPVPDGRDVNDMRAYYVGLSRAKRNLYLVPDTSVQYSSIFIALSMRDVWLDFFKGRKDVILRLRSGDSLQYNDGYLLNEYGMKIAALSASGKEKLKVWTDKGYVVTSVKVSFTLAWKPQGSDVEYAVCLANIVLTN